MKTIAVLRPHPCGALPICALQPGFAVVLRGLTRPRGQWGALSPGGGFPRNFSRKWRPAGAPAHPKNRTAAWKKMFLTLF